MVFTFTMLKLLLPLEPSTELILEIGVRRVQSINSFTTVLLKPFGGAPQNERTI